MTYWFWRILLLQRHVADKTVKGRDPTLLSLLLVRVKSAKLHFLPFHMTRQLDCSCSSVNEAIMVQKEFVATVKCFMKNHAPSTFGLASRGCLVYPSWIPEICEGPWAFGSVHVTAHLRTFRPQQQLRLCSFWISVTAEETRIWTYSQSHTLSWTCLFSTSTSNPLRSYMMLYGHLHVCSPPPTCKPQGLQFHFISPFHCREYSELHVIKKNTENEILVVKYTSLQLF